MKTFNEFLKEENELLLEMPTYSPKRTGLPTPIYGSTKQGKHWARIKFKSVLSGKNSENWPSIRVDNLEIEGEYDSKKDKNAIDAIKQRITSSKDIIEKFWKEEIGEPEFLKGMGIKSKEEVGEN